MLPLREYRTRHAPISGLPRAWVGASVAVLDKNNEVEFLGRSVNATMQPAVIVRDGSFQLKRETLSIRPSGEDARNDACQVPLVISNIFLVSVFLYLILFLFFLSQTEGTLASSQRFSLLCAFARNALISCNEKRFLIPQKKF
jgi:hypothetical protein